MTFFRLSTGFISSTWSGSIAQKAMSQGAGPILPLERSALIHSSSVNPSTEAEMASIQNLIVEGIKAGWLLECEGVTFGTTGVRVHKSADGEVTVTDGPFAESKEVLGGYALLNAASKEEAVEHTRRFLDQIGQETGEGTWEGAWETYKLFEMPA
jgi:hypothetical protein